MANFLIYDGPDHSLTQVYALIGCAGICNGSRGF